MLAFSYNLSAKLKEHIEKIENLRRKLILTPLSPYTEKRMQWEAMVNRVRWVFVSRKLNIGKGQLIDIFNKEPKAKTSPEIKIAIAYKKAFNYLYLNWLVTNRRVTSYAVRSLNRIVSGKNTVSLSKKQEQEINFFFDYLQTGQVHPVIQAGIAENQFLSLAPLPSGNEIIANLLGYLFLYKSGYDMRRMLVKEEFLYRDASELTRVREASTKSQNLTVWLEDYSEDLYTQLAKAYQLVISNKFTVEISPTFWKLNKRQQEILSYLQEPNKKINNREVQQTFGVSQITASRDLSKMVASGLVIPHGKGRSIYYTLA